MTYRELILSLNPMAYWPFDDAPGLTLADASPNGHDITLTSMTGITFGVPGVGDGTGIALDGTEEIGLCVPFNFFGAPTLGTFLCWVRPGFKPGPSGDAGMLLSDIDNVNGFWLQNTGIDTHVLSYFQWLENGDYIGDNYITLTTSDAAMDVGGLYMLVYTLDGIGPGHVQIFINGVATGPPRPTPGQVASNIPGHPDSASPAFFNDEFPFDILNATLLDDMALFDRVLTTSEIQQLYRAALPAPRGAAMRTAVITIPTPAAPISLLPTDMRDVACAGLTLQGGPANAGVIYIGDSDVSTTEYMFALGPAVATVPPVPVAVYHPSGSLGQLSGFYAIGTAGEVVHVGIVDR